MAKPKIAVVNSSSELLFQQGALTFGWGADVHLGWNERPAVSLDMEFRHDAVTVFFALGLCGDGETVSIRMISFDAPHEDPLVNTARLISALNASRCVSPRI